MLCCRIDERGVVDYSPFVSEVNGSGSGFAEASEASVSEERQPAPSPGATDAILSPAKGPRHETSYEFQQAYTSTTGAPLYVDVFRKCY